MRKTGAKVETEVVLGITSVPRERAGAKELLALTRGHWGIENGLHGVRDGTLREDASRIRKGSATQVMAVVRNVVIFLFNRHGYKNAAAATRHECEGARRPRIRLSCRTVRGPSRLQASRPLRASADLSEGLGQQRC